MARFGSADVKDRFFGAAVYLFALYDAMVLGGLFATQFPAILPIVQLLSLLIAPVALIYNTFNSIIPIFGGFIVFFILFLAVVRNEKVSYFIRFNTLQSILFGIALALIQIVFGQIGALLAIIAGPVFILAAGASLFCMAQCALGRYPEIPTISAAVSSQLPR